jgi:hypothetical protein
MSDLLALVVSSLLMVGLLFMTFLAMWAVLRNPDATDAQADDTQS